MEHIKVKIGMPVEDKITGDRYKVTEIAQAFAGLPPIVCEGEKGGRWCGRAFFAHELDEVKIETKTKEVIKIQATVDGVEIMAVQVTVAQLVKHPKVTGEVLMEDMIEGLKKNFIIE